MCLLHQVTRQFVSEIFHLFLARRICSIVEVENTKLKLLSELKTSLKQQKYSITLIKDSIKKALQIPLNELRKAKLKEEKKLYSSSLLTILITLIFFQS